MLVCRGAGHHRRCQRRGVRRGSVWWQALCRMLTGYRGATSSISSQQSPDRRRIWPSASVAAAGYHSRSHEGNTEHDNRRHQPLTATVHASTSTAASVVTLCAPRRSPQRLQGLRFGHYTLRANVFHHPRPHRPLPHRQWKRAVLPAFERAAASTGATLWRPQRALCGLLAVSVAADGLRGGGCAPLHSNERR